MDFYHKDDISRMCPGKKDFLSVVNLETGKKEQIQKRLVLMNLKETYALYKKDLSNSKVGFSTFASLRPKFCVLAGTAGTHSVCVCKYHQNTKLQISSLGISEIDYKVLIEKSVCSIDNRSCMMHLCNSCPKEQGVIEFLDSLESVSDKEEFKYKQWVSVDRCSLVETIEQTSEFIQSLSEKIVKLTRHHYIAKSQSSFLNNLKKNLNTNEAILLLDFSENYSFIIQDEVQSYHWKNVQCTVHPFVLYHKDSINGDVIHKSFCFLSPDLKHSTTMVYTFICNLMSHISLNLPHIKKCIILVMGVLDSTKIASIFPIFIIILVILILNVNGTFLPLHMAKVSVMVLVE